MNGNECLKEIKRVESTWNGVEVVLNSDEIGTDTYVVWNAIFFNGNKRYIATHSVHLTHDLLLLFPPCSLFADSTTTTTTSRGLTGPRITGT